MRIVGQASGDKLLLEATPDEIANLLGFYYSGDEDLRKAGFKIGPGMEFKVSAEYQKVYWLRQRNREFEGLIQRLRETADAIECSRPAFDVVAGEPAKEPTA